MRAIGRRLVKLEKIFAPVLDIEYHWGSIAEFRNELLAQAEQRGAPSVAELSEELGQLGPLGLWREAARGYRVHPERERKLCRNDGASTRDQYGQVKGLYRGKSNRLGVAGGVQGPSDRYR